MAQNRFDHKHNETLSLQKSLETSLVLESLVPGVFEGGGARCLWDSRWPHTSKQDFTLAVLSHSLAIWFFTGDEIPDELFNDFMTSEKEIGCVIFKDKSWNPTTTGSETPWRMKQ